MTKRETSTTAVEKALSVPRPDADEIRRTLGILRVAPEHVHELRILGSRKGYKFIDAGYFDQAHAQDLITAAVEANQRQKVQVYITLNPVVPQLLGRYNNRIELNVKNTTSDKDVLQRVWLLIDIDPQRPADTSATDSQLEAARQKGQEVIEWLRSQGWPLPVLAASGNGIHLLYRIDLPNDDDSKVLLQNCLKALAARFDDDVVKIDQSVFNAARIVKLHGTVAGKGDHTNDTPHRLSRLLNVPEPLEIVLQELLELLGRPLPAKAIPAPSKPKRNGTWSFDAAMNLAQEVIATLNLYVVGEKKGSNGDHIFMLRHCVFNPEHANKDAAIMVSPDGVLKYNCFHSSCSDKSWRDVRELAGGPINRHSNSEIETDAAMDAEILGSLLDRVATDCGVVYESEVIAALGRLRKRDKPEFMRLRAQLKKINPDVILDELGKDLNTFSRTREKSESSPPTLSTLSGGYPSLTPALKEKALHFQDVLIREDENGKRSLCPQSEAAVLLAEQLRGQYAYDIEAGCWYRFDVTHWQEIKQLEIEEAVTALLYVGAGELGFSNAYQNGSMALMQKGGGVVLGERPRGKIPFENGLLDLATKTLAPTTCETALTWYLPFHYDAVARSDAFINWLVTALDGDQETVWLLRAFINAVLTGRADLQRFLHLIGPAGTGKSTFGRLLFTMVGAANSTTTSLKQLEENRFETAGIHGKRLVCIEEADKYGGSVSVLKAMTGQDPLRLERKNQQQRENFIYDGQVLMMSNERLATSDYTSGIERRRVTVEFTRRITPEERAQWEQQGGEETILHAEIPGIINWALGLSRFEVTEAFRVMPERVRRANLDAALFNNPLADWLAECCIPDPGAKTQIGDGRQVVATTGERVFISADERLYPNYRLWCQRSGRENVSLQRFGAALIDAAKQFGVTIRKNRTGADGTHFEGLRLRREGEQTWKERLESGEDLPLVQDIVKANCLKMLRVQEVEGSAQFLYPERTHTHPASNRVEVEI